MIELGHNYRLTDFQSALGITQLIKNNKGVERRNEIALIYKNAFKNKVKFQKVSLGSYNAYHLFIIEIDNRKGLYDYLKLNKILTQIHYIPIHTHPYYKKIGYQDANLFYSERFYSKCLSLPMYPSLNSEEQNFVISKVLEFISNEK